MKTTLDIADNIAIQTRKLAEREHVAFKSLVEEGLLLVLRRNAAQPKHRVKPVTFKGNGLTQEFQPGTWSSVRDAIYSGHGS
jgi:hypothetical protein